MHIHSKKTNKNVVFAVTKIELAVRNPLLKQFTKAAKYITQMINKSFKNSKKKQSTTKYFKQNAVKIVEIRI